MMLFINYDMNENDGTAYYNSNFNENPYGS